MNPIDFTSPVTQAFYGGAIDVMNSATTNAEDISDSGVGASSNMYGYCLDTAHAIDCSWMQIESVLLLGLALALVLAVFLLVWVVLEY